MNIWQANGKHNLQEQANDLCSLMFVLKYLLLQFAILISEGSSFHSITSYFKGRNFRGRNFREFANIWQNRKSLLPRKIFKEAIRESLISGNISKRVIRESLISRNISESVIREAYSLNFAIFSTRESFSRKIFFP